MINNDNDNDSDDDNDNDNDNNDYNDNSDNDEDVVDIEAVNDQYIILAVFQNWWLYYDKLSLWAPINTWCFIGTFAPVPHIWQWLFAYNG